MEGPGTAIPRSSHTAPAWGVSGSLEPFRAKAGESWAHSQWPPSLGLRSWRTFSVPPDTVAWEGETEAPGNEVTGPRP